MGLLDDAIREHLALKRARGADPTEVDRAEREALGPVRRTRAGEMEDPELGSDAGYSSHPADVEFAQEGSHEPHADELEYAHHEAGYALEDDEYEHDEDEYEDEFEHDPHGYEDEPAAMRWHEPPPAAVHPPVPAPAPPPPTEPPAPHHLGGETVEYDVEHALANEPQHGDEDVLEETPDFLQDTPDHDRLWFEQKPPRDFDFDG